MTPEFSISIYGGKNITSRVRDRLLSLRITDCLGMQSDTLELVLDDRDGMLKTPVPGTQFEVGLGYQEEGKLTHHGLFVYDETEFDLATNLLTIRARADNFRSSYKEPRSRSFENKSLADILGKIASDNKYILTIDSALGDVQIDHLDQHWESDMNLVNRLGKKYGAASKVANNELVFIPFSCGNKQGSGSHIVLRPVDVSGGTVTRIDREQWGSVTANYYNAKQGKLLSVTHGSGKPELILAKMRDNQSDAAAVAKSVFEDQERSTASLKLNLPGRGDLKPNAELQMQDWRDGVNGKWLIKKVDHVLDNAGYQCTVEAEVCK